MGSGSFPCLMDSSKYPGSPAARPVSPLPTSGTDYSLIELPLPEATSLADSKKRKIKEKMQIKK